MVKYKVLLTGSTGFVGSHLANHLSILSNIQLTCALRSDLGLEKSVKGQDVIIHLAGKNSYSNSDSVDNLFFVNVDETIKLAKLAAKFGVKRFIYISSLKVNGEKTFLGQPFTADDIPNPEDLYGLSKLKAERGLFELVASMNDMEIVIIRPPLIYGPGVKGNFSILYKLAATGLPLPLGGIENARSFVGIRNLIDFIVCCIDHPAAANQVFLVSDGDDLSTSELLSRLSKAIGKPSYLLNVPAKVLQILFTCIGKRVIAQRLLGNLQADIGKSCDLLGWTPPFSVDDCLKYCVENNIETNKSTQNFSLRFFDIIFSAFGLIVGLPVFGVIFLSGWFDTGSPLFFQERIGRNKKPFTLVKFRTMKLDTASVASHLASSSSITRMGAILRKTKLDELPQLWNVLKGEMSLVGPRPCLFNQDELIRERDERGVFAVRPGVTGLAQVNEIDMSTPELLAKTDLEMIETMSVKNYFRFIFMTIAGNGAGDCIKK